MIDSATREIEAMTATDQRKGTIVPAPRPTIAEQTRVSDDDIDELIMMAQNAVNMWGDRSARRTMAAWLKLKALRTALRDAKPAIDFLVHDNDGWIECHEKSLLDPEYGTAVKDYDKFIADVREDNELRKKHSATLRALVGRIEG